MFELIVGFILEATSKSPVPIEPIHVAQAYVEPAVVPTPEPVVEVPRETVGCSCVKAAREVVPNLPRGDADGFVPNTTMLNGQVVLLTYNGVRHVTAYKLTPEGLKTINEGNFGTPCSIQSRVITWKELNEHIVGFARYDPSPASLAYAKGGP